MDKHLLFAQIEYLPFALDYQLYFIQDLYDVHSNQRTHILDMSGANDSLDLSPAASQNDGCAGKTTHTFIYLCHIDLPIY